MSKPSPDRARGRRVALLLALLLAASAIAQEKKDKKKEGKKSEAAEPLHVRLNAAVLDAQNRAVGDLSAEDLQILEDGAPQKVTHFERREGPLAFGLVVDNSGSFREIIDQVIDLGQTLVAGSGPGAEAFAVRFVSSDRINIVRDMTASKPALAAALDDMYVEGGQTAVTDAVYLAAEHLSKYKAGQTSPRRYGLVLVSDGEDRSSYYKAEQLHDKLRETGLPVYVLGVVKGSRLQSSPAKSRQYLERLAFESGGLAFIAEQPAQLRAAVQQILRELSAAYRLGYDSTNPKRDGKTRKLEVKAASKNAPGPLTVYAKAEYVAPKK